MSKSGQRRVSRTDDIPFPNEYIKALRGEFADWCFDEQQAPLQRGKWRGLFQRPFVDVEIGVGNGLHFAHRAERFSDRGILGIELRYKPLIQSIRRCLRAGCTNARVARYNAYLVDDLFAPEEIDDVFIFFPDPWEKKRHYKHRLIQDEFLEQLHRAQNPGRRVFFKTDSEDYFQWSVEKFQNSPYEIVHCEPDLHRSPLAAENFITQFERIFIRQGLKIGYVELKKKE